MKITVMFFGALRQQAGQEKVDFALPDGAVFGDLLDSIGHRFGGKLDRRIWDTGTNTFKSGVKAAGNGRYLEARETALMNGEQIMIMPALAGG